MIDSLFFLIWVQSILIIDRSIKYQPNGIFFRLHLFICAWVSMGVNMDTYWPWQCIEFRREFSGIYFCLHDVGSGLRLMSSGLVSGTLTRWEISLVQYNEYVSSYRLGKINGLFIFKSWAITALHFFSTLITLYYLSFYSLENALGRYLL